MAAVNGFHGEDLFAGEKLSPGQQAQDQPFSPWLGRLDHEQAVKQDKEKRGTGYEHLRQVTDGLGGHVRRKADHKAAGQGG
jgi:hypothetical protein